MSKLSFKERWIKNNPGKDFIKECFRDHCPDDFFPKNKRNVEEFCKRSKENCLECWNQQKIH